MMAMPMQPSTAPVNAVHARMLGPVKRATTRTPSQTIEPTTTIRNKSTSRAGGGGGGGSDFPVSPGDSGSSVDAT